MIPVQFIYLAVLINFIAAVGYARATLRGKTQPNRVSWLVWGLAPLIPGIAQITHGVGLSTLIVFTAAFNPLMIFACSFVNKKAYWKITPFDYACGFLALGGLAMWYMASDQNYAIAFSILGDFFASIPTIRKAWTHPQSEHAYTFGMMAIGGIIGVLCVQQPTFTAYAFVVYLAIINLAVYLIIHSRRSGIRLKAVS